jgi:hypothetical protein
VGALASAEAAARVGAVLDPSASLA